MTALKIPVLVSVLLCAACTTVKHDVHVSTALQARELNVVSQYMERPTYVATEKVSDGNTVLMVRMETYAIPRAYRTPDMEPELADQLRHIELRFAKRNVSAYVAAIDKFVAWAALAAQRKDAFTKEIATVPTWGNTKGVMLQFSFRSGNDQAHFLGVTIVTPAGNTEDQAEYFDVANAKELKRLLLGFSSATLQKTDLDSVYK